MAAPDNRCDVCKSVGLAVYMPRYTAVPKSFNAPDLGPFSGEKVKSIPLMQAKYALRQLREGFVYLFYEMGACGRFYWEVYAVGPDGTLWKQLDSASAKEVTDLLPCRRDGHEPLRPLYLVIENPEHCGKVWVAFSERKWSDETVKRYGGRDAAAAELRARRMQAIEPAKWISAQTTDGHKAPLTQANLEHVIECAPQISSSYIGEAKDLPHTDLPDKVSTGAKGAFQQAQLEACGSLYSWTLRSWDKWAGPRSDVAQMVVQAQASTVAGCPPMMLALWDGIGITHELNGYRNDAQARFLQYCDEQAIQINAMEWIDQAKQAVRAGAQKKATFDHSPGISGSSSYYFPEEVAKQRAAAKTSQDKQFWNDYEWMGQNGVPPHYARQLTTFRSIPSSSYYQDTMAQARAWLAANPGKQAEQGKLIAKDTESGSQHDWGKYEEKLGNDPPGQSDHKLVETFRTFYKDIQDKKQTLLGLRTADIAAWLDAPLLLATLEDYHEENGLDGLAFEFAIFHAIVGLNTDPQGVSVLNTLIDRLDPTKADSLVWRMVASNQKEPKQALQAALAQARAHKDTLLDKAGEGYNVFAEASEKLKKFAEFFEQMAGLSKQAQPLNAADRLMHEKKVDKFVVAVGDLVFKKFGFKGLNLESLGNGVGEAIVRSVCLIRVGVNAQEVRELMLVEASRRPEIQQKLLSEFQRQIQIGRTTEDAFQRATNAVAETEASSVLASRWKNVKGNEGVGLVGVVGLIEVFCLLKLVGKKEKEGRDYAELTGACFSVAAATAIVAAKGMDIMKVERTAATFKMIAGYFGALAAGVGTALDGLDMQKSFANDENLVGWLYLGKAVGGAFSTAAFALTALSSSAPFLERVATNVTGRQIRFVFLNRVAQGLADAAGTEAVVASERLAMMALGRFILILSAWEIQVAIIAIQILIWAFSDDDLQQAIGKSVFGSNPEYKTNADLLKQDKAMDKALVALGMKSEDNQNVAETEQAPA